MTLQNFMVNHWSNRPKDEISIPAATTLARLKAGHKSGETATFTVR